MAVEWGIELGSRPGQLSLGGRGSPGQGSPRRFLRSRAAQPPPFFPGVTSLFSQSCPFLPALKSDNETNTQYFCLQERQEINKKAQGIKVSLLRKGLGTGWELGDIFVWS